METELLIFLCASIQSIRNLSLSEMPKVTVKNSSGDTAATFETNPDKSIGVQAQENGAPIPFSCGVGACRTCLAVVQKGKEYLNEEAVGPKYITTEENEILTCICGVKADAPKDAEIEIKCDNI